MKKLLLITDAWEPQTNGVVTTLKQVTSRLPEFGFEAVVVHPGDFKQLPLPSYPEIRIARNPWKLKHMLERVRPDACHIATEGPLGLFARGLFQGRRIPFTTSLHTKFPEYAHERIRLPLSAGYGYIRWFHRPAVRTLCTTESLKEELTAWGLSDLVVWRRGVDTDRFRPAQAPQPPHDSDAADAHPEETPGSSAIGARSPHDSDAAGAHPEETPGSSTNGARRPFGSDAAGLRAEHSSRRPRLLYVGRIAVEKNVEAFLGLDIDADKIMVGDGPQRMELQAKYLDAQWLGYRKGQALIDEYAAADVFVFPSRTDTFGLVMLEALACGTPVAAYPVTGPKDVVRQGVTGWLDEDLRVAVEKALVVNRENCRAYAVANGWPKIANTLADNLAIIDWPRLGRG